MSTPQITAILLLACASGAFLLARRRADGFAEQWRDLHSLPRYHGWFVALSILLPGLVFLALFLMFREPAIQSLTEAQLPERYADQSVGERSLTMSQINRAESGGDVFGSLPEGTEPVVEYLSGLRSLSRWLVFPAVLIPAFAGWWFARRRLGREFRARNATETIVRGLMILCAGIAILTTFGIVMSVLFEALRFFGRVSPLEFFTSTTWDPGSAMGDDDAAAGGDFGIVPLFAGTLLIASIAMCVAVPFGLLSAIYLAEYASRRVRGWLKPAIEILAGIPTVVYGVFAALTVGPAIIDLFTSLGFGVGAKNALAAGAVMGIMLIPFISSLSDDVLDAVPSKLRDGAYTLGATQGEVVWKVVVPAALPGIVGAVLLAVSRAIGETMIVLLAAGLRANLTANPLDTTTTVTVQIASLLTGDQQFDSAKTLSAFALGLVLFAATLLLNLAALVITRRYREEYE